MHILRLPLRSASPPVTKIENEHNSRLDSFPTLLLMAFLGSGPYGFCLLGRGDYHVRVPPASTMCAVPLVRFAEMSP